MQWVNAVYKRSEGSDHFGFEPLPEVNQYTIDFVSKPPNNNDAKEMMKLLQV